MMYVPLVARVVLALVVAVVVAASRQTYTFSCSRTIAIDASPEMVFSIFRD